ncbi:MAG: hypothetical protein EOO40_03265, partial [Deltaproteobacteria bacterium]
MVMCSRGRFVLFYSFLACACGQSTQPEPDAPLVHTTFGSFRLDGLPRLDDELAGDLSQPGRYLVQFRRPIDEHVRLGLAQMSIAVLGYVPDDALLVVADGKQVRWLGAQPQVQAVAPQPALLKLHPSLARFGRGRREARLVAEAGDYLVEVSQPRFAAGVAQAAQAMGAQLRGAPQGGRLLRIGAERAVLQRLAELPQVDSIEPHAPKKTFNDHSFGVLQSAQMFRAPIWRHGLLGHNQLVGICDTGVDTRSCFFAGSKIAAYQNLATVDDHDGAGHGTHVAGTIAGDMGANSIYDMHDGMAPAARLVVQDVGNGADLVGIPDDLGELFARAYDIGVRIHSNSWGGGDNTYDAVARSVDRFVSTHPDFLPLFANGNT